MSLRLAAPLTGTVVALSAVPDETFAGEILGPGVALEPAEAAIVTVFAPCAGRVVKVHPHAVALEADQDDDDDAPRLGILVHLGIDTVSLKGRGFEVLVADGERVGAGQELIRWDVSVARLERLATVSPVVILSPLPLTLEVLAELGAPVAAGAPLLEAGRGQESR